ncbi:MAG: hypothetical protein MUO31_00865 [Thermodesulfovibrionales bacterium]|nr:hypothetical protein [Thermodesulfovibrionales bacterium]
MNEKIQTGIEYIRIPLPKYIEVDETGDIYEFKYYDREPKWFHILLRIITFGFHNLYEFDIIKKESEQNE